MRKAVKFLALVLFLAAAGGLLYALIGDYNITSSGVVLSQVFDGNISVVGSKNDITIQAGSEVEVVTLLGKDNTIRIEPGAVVHKIRGAGPGNQILKPPGMEVATDLLSTEKPSQTPQAPAPSRPLDGL